MSGPTLNGHEAGSIAQTLGVNERTVRRVVERYHEGGVAGLKRQSSSGRTCSVSQAEREALIALIRRSPEEFGFSTERWTLADLAAVAQREGMLGGVSSWTLRRELARIIQLEPDLEERLHLPGQPRPGAPPENHNALRHGAYGRQPLSGDERALLAEIEADLRRDFPGAGEAEPEAGMIREAAVAFMQFSRTIPADFRESDMRTSLRWRKALRALKAAAKAAVNATISVGKGVARRSKVSRIASASLEPSKLNCASAARCRKNPSCDCSAREASP